MQILDEDPALQPGGAFLTHRYSGKVTSMRVSHALVVRLAASHCVDVGGELVEVAHSGNLSGRLKVRYLRVDCRERGL
jgi:hypothetical protein